MKKTRPRQATAREPVSGAVSLLTLAICAGLLALAVLSGGRPAEAAVPPQAGTPIPTSGSYAIDPPHTFIYFEVQHKVVGRVHGRFDTMTGTIVVAQDPAACSVDVSIEAASLSTQNSVRDADLRGPDFFDTARFPVITYRGQGVRRSGEGWVIDGMLTIRGTTRAVPLSFVFRGTAPPQPGKPGRIAFHATAAVKRAEFGMTRELLDEIGAVSPSPDVWIDIDTELLAGAPAPRP
jgi:polyisoprenoid-binding protein YceI